MADNEKFQQFYLKLTILNYKIKTNNILSDGQKRQLDILKYIIPIFDRIADSPALELKHIINNGECQQLQGPKKEEEVIEAEVPDEIGDQQVDSLTRKALEIFDKIKNDNWFKVKDLAENDESNGEDDDEVDDDSDESDNDDECHYNNESDKEDNASDQTTYDKFKEEYDKEFRPFTDNFNKHEDEQILAFY